LIRSTFHPNWERSDGKTIYAATPFFILTFVDQQVTINYERRRLDQPALWISAAVFAFVCLLAALRFLKRRR